MILLTRLCLLLCLFTQPVWAAENPVVDIQTNQGTITLQLAADKAPLTVANFLNYVTEGFYENTLFHRVIPGFVIQGGGFTPALTQKATHSPIKLESNNTLSNLRGTVAMARTFVADSATAQFFINSVDNKNLDYQSAANPGYAVFATVTEGMAIVDNISKVKTTTQGNLTDIPVEPIIIEAARVREAQLNFSGLKTAYQVGDNLALVLSETNISRQRALDLWVAVKMPSGELRFFSPENNEWSSLQAKPFGRKVGTSKTQHIIITLTIPPGVAGEYSVYAIFNEPDKDIADLTHSLKSNLASATFKIR